MQIQPAYSAMMLAESEYIASVHSIIRGTAQEVADIFYAND